MSSKKKKRKTSGAAHQHILKGKHPRLAVPLESPGHSRLTSESSFHSFARDENTSTDTCMPNSHTYSESENISSSICSFYHRQWFFTFAYVK